MSEKTYERSDELELLARDVIASDERLANLSLANIGYLQAAVGGYIEVVTLGGGQAAVVNEESKINDLPFNRALYAGVMDPVDYLFGNVLIVGTDGEDFLDLTPAELASLTQIHRATTSAVAMWRRSV